MFVILLVIWAGINSLVNCSVSLAGESHVSIYRDYKHLIDEFKRICDDLHALEASLEATKALLEVLDEQIYTFERSEPEKLKIAIARKKLTTRIFMEHRESLRIVHLELDRTPTFTIQVAHDYFELLKGSLFSKFLRAKKRRSMKKMLWIKYELEIVRQYYRVAESTLKLRLASMSENDMAYSFGTASKRPFKSSNADK